MIVRYTDGTLRPYGNSIVRADWRGDPPLFLVHVFPSAGCSGAPLRVRCGTCKGTGSRCGGRRGFDVCRCCFTCGGLGDVPAVSGGECTDGP